MLFRFAEVPTWKELGIDSAFDLWRGLAGPRGMHPAQVAFWDDALGRMVRSEEWRKELESHAVADIYKNSAETAKHWKAEYDEVRAVFSELGMAVR